MLRRDGPTSTDSRDQETHIFQVRLIIKKPSPGRAWQRTSPQAALIREGEFTQPVWEIPTSSALVEFLLHPHRHRKTCL